MERGSKGWKWKGEKEIEMETGVGDGNLKGRRG